MNFILNVILQLLTKYKNKCLPGHSNFNGETALMLCFYKNPNRVDKRFGNCNIIINKLLTFNSVLNTIDDKTVLALCDDHYKDMIMKLKADKDAKDSNDVNVNDVKANAVVEVAFSFF